MKLRLTILIFICLLQLLTGKSYAQNERQHHVEFYGDTVMIPLGTSAFVDFNKPLSDSSVREFYKSMESAGYLPVIEALTSYRENKKPDDWLFYQLIRKTAQMISPKTENYQRYTLYKWYFLLQTGYDAILTINGNKMLMYAQSNDAIYEIPFRTINHKQYVCLNYHDYGQIDFDKNVFTQVAAVQLQPKRIFSYSITRLPAFTKSKYREKDISFIYNESRYAFKIRINQEVKDIFANYPVVDYEKYFNIPLSEETYSSLVPSLKKVLRKMSQKEGVAYLMYFTRHSFVYKTDTEVFGKEKRLSPEQTLLYEYSDCEDRAALFFFLVKEIYNLPMIALAFPKHVTVAVKFDKPIGETILYKGEHYSICEPTPQAFNLSIGQTPKDLMKTAFEVVYAYHPVK
jgi:hypothetical protein